MVDKIETVLAIIATSLDGTIILTEDTNINVKEITKISQCYIEMLNNLDFEQQHSQQEQVKKNDHISSNRPSKIVYTNVILSISDQDAPCIMAKIPTEHFQPRIKYIKISMNFNLNDFLKDFKTLPIFHNI